MNRYGKETGKATGSLNKPKGSSVKKGGSSDAALNFVRNKIRKETGRPEGQRKKVKGEKKQEGPSAGVRKARGQLLMLLHGRTIIKKKWSMRSQ